jgi:hypothetical protein
MVQDLRFSVLIAGILVTAISGGIWMKMDAPVPAAATAEALTPDAILPAIETSAQAGIQHEGPNSQTPQSDGDVIRDKLRSAAMTAGEAYALSPCDSTTKANFVAAVSAYAKAWRDKMGCGFSGCNEKKLQVATVAFSTPFDQRVHDSVRTAFNKGGISVYDFPPPLRENVSMLTRGEGNFAPACSGARAEIVR